MTYIGTVAKGAVVLPPDVKLPEGTRVRVEPLDEPVKDMPVGNWLLRFAGVVKDLPPDFAENHDHYIHGTPKK